MRVRLDGTLFPIAPTCLALSCWAGACSTSPPTASDGGVPGLPSDAGGDAPSLMELRVSARASSSPVTLMPAFSPGIHDYYVRCGAGTNALTVSMKAALGASALLLQPAPSPSLPEQTLSIEINENQAIVATASDGTASTEYWVRCLPHDFPELVMEAHPRIGTPPPGYYLVGNRKQSGGVDGYAMVLNGDGVPVWYLRSPGLGASDVDTLVAGTVSLIPIPVSFADTGTQPFEIRQLAAAVTTRVKPMGYGTNTHELRVLSNGNYLALADPLKFGVDLTGLTLPLPDGGTRPLGPDSIIQDCAVVEFNPAGDVVSVWLGSDHFDPAKDSTFPLDDGVTAPDGGAAIDAFHCNSIDVDPENGNLLVSARHMDSIFYIDRPSGNVLWKMGGAVATLDHAAYVSVPDPFFRQHDARLQPGWSPSCKGGTGQISLFDDESETGAPARAVIYDVAVGASTGDRACTGLDAPEPETAGQATVAWQYKGLTSSDHSGSFRISADGSRVICWGGTPTPNLIFTEVDVAGDDLLDFHFNNGNSSYRAIKAPLTAFDLEVLRRVAGLP
jgi:hypothetical protein